MKTVGGRGSSGGPWDVVGCREAGEIGSAPADRAVWMARCRSSGWSPGLGRFCRVHLGCRAAWTVCTVLGRPRPYRLADERQPGLIAPGRERRLKEPIERGEPELPNGRSGRRNWGPSVVFHAPHLLHAPPRRSMTPPTPLPMGGTFIKACTGPPLGEARAGGGTGQRFWRGVKGFGGVRDFGGGSEILEVWEGSIDKFLCGID